MQFDAAPKNNSVCTNGSHQKNHRSGRELAPALSYWRRLDWNFWRLRSDDWRSRSCRDSGGVKNI